MLNLHCIVLYIFYSISKSIWTIAIDYCFLPYFQIDNENVRGNPNIVKQNLSETDLKKLRELIFKRIAAKKVVFKLNKFSKKNKKIQTINSFIMLKEFAEIKVKRTRHSSID